MKTVILLRHADVDVTVGPAPETLPLNAAGVARAHALVHVAGDAGVTAMFASPAKRTQQTLKPLAEKLGLQVSIPNSQQALVQDALSNQSGAVVLIAGHSNTVPQIITALGALFVVPTLQGHDDLFVVTVMVSGHASLVHLKYGN